jgi:hypothetical protein
MISSYYLKSSIAGLIMGLVTIKFVNVSMLPFYHVILCTSLAGLFSIFLLSPNVILMFTALVCLPIGWYFQKKFGFFSYSIFILSASYIAWTRTETLQHFIKLIKDPGYKQRFEDFKKRRDE